MGHLAALHRHPAPGGRAGQHEVLVIAEIAPGLVLDLTVHSARFTLARGSLFVALAGVWILASVCTSRAVSVNGAQAFVARKGAANVAAVGWLAENSSRFLRIHRSLSVLGGAMFLAYAAVRVILLCSLSISRAVWLTEVPGIIAIAVCVIASRQAGQRVAALISDRMAAEAAEPASRPAGPGAGDEFRARVS